MKVLSLSLWLLLLRLLEISSWGQNYLRGKYREWIEDNDRVEVRSWYAETEVDLEKDWSFNFLGQLMHGPELRQMDYRLVIRAQPYHG